MDIKLLRKIIIVLFLNGILGNAYANNNLTVITFDSYSKKSDSIVNPIDFKIPAILKFNQYTTNALPPSPDATLGGTGSGTTADAFKICTTANTAVFTFTNLSTTTGTNLKYTIKWGDGTPDWTSTTNWVSTTHTYAVGLRTLTYIVEGTSGITTKTYTVFLGSNPAIALGNPGNTDICIGDSLTFPITGTQNNDPGTIYTVTINDGTPPQIFTHATLPSQITHQFNKKSCGTTSSDGSTFYPNSFSINIVATNLCTSSSVGVVPIYVSALPVAQFSGPTKACVNTQVCFANTSEGFQVSGGLCLEPKNVWSISPATGYTVSGGSVLGNDYGSNDASVWALGTNDLCITFTQPGTYSITIKSGSKCGLNDYTDTYTRTICIEPQLVAAFSTSTALGCAPLAVSTTNTTAGVNQCPPTIYQWNVSYSSSNCGGGSGNYAYTNGTNSNSAEPKFNFIEPGTYTVTLNTTNSCGSSPVSKTIVVKGPPKVSIQSISNICRTSAITTINPSANINKCTSNASGMTYDWDFPGGTPSSSSNQNPGPITYNTTGTFTVSLTVTNECGTKTANNKTFTIYPLPVISGALSACVNATSQLSASIAGNATSWTSSPSGIVSITSGGLVKGLTAGTTTITYTDVNGCSKSEIFKVNPLPTATITSDQTICKGATADITLTGANGVAPYTFTYNINFGPNTTVTTTSGNKVVLTVPTNVTGTFTYNLIKVSDASTTNCENNQPGSATIIINKIPTVTLQPISPQKICIGATINTLEAVVDGGAGNTNFQWYKNTNNSSIGGTLIPGATNDKFTPPAFTTAGTFYYYVTATLSANGCGVATSASAEVTVAPDPTIITQPITPQTLCQGSPANALKFVADSGNSDPLKYQWYSNAFNSNLGGTPIPNEVYDTFTPSTTTTGTFYYYCVIKPLGLDCEKISDVSVVNVVSGPSITVQPQPSAICVGGTPTKLSVTYINGTGTASYQWFSNTINSNSGGTAIPSATTANYNPPALVKGTVYYYVEITFSAGGCTNLVSDTAEVKINEGLNIASKNITICSGATFTIVPDNTNGDTVPAGTTYTWSYPSITPSGDVSGASSQSSAQNNITQTLVNTSRNPVTVIYTVKPFGGICLGSDFTITATVNPTIEVETVITNSTCNGINNGKIATTITGGTPITVSNPYNILWSGPNGFSSTNANISNLAAGIYYLSVDAGCTYTNNYTVTEPDPLVLITDNEKDITCFQDADGEIAISIDGGTKPYTYQWTKNNIPFSTSEDISNLGPGTYKITVTDANNCTPISHTYNITEPNVLAVTLVNQTPKLCFGSSDGVINVSTQGGTPIGFSDYNYSWTGPNGFISTDKNLTQLKAGTYNLTVTDNSGCTDDLEVTILETDELIITATTTPITCYGLDNASITVSISGGSPAYNISWSNLSSGLFQENLSAGNYTIKVKDAFGCEKELTINIPEVPVFTVNPISKNISCYGANDGSIALNLSGNTSGVKLVWSDGSTAGTTRNNLAPGQYTVTLNNGSPCEIVRTFTIIEPLELSINAGFSQPDACNATDNGMIDLQVSGGTKPYNYSWTKNNIPFSSNEDLSNLGAGIYNVSVTDANFCEVKFKTFVLTKPTILKVDLINQTPKICFGSNDGSIVIAASGGTPIEITAGVFDYYYSWTGPNGFASSAQNLNNLYAGTYNLVISDKSGCSKNLAVIIPESQEIIIKATTTPITCFGMNNGTIAVTISGGNPNYQISWSNGATGLTQQDLAPGNYTITIKDALGCEKEKTINIAPVPAIVLNPIIKNASCFGVNDGSIDLNFANNSPTVSLLWSDGSTAGTNRNNLAPGIYKVTINSGSPCQIERTFEITAPLDLNLNATVTQPDACNPIDNGMIDLIVSGGTAPYSYQWTKNNITFASSEDVSNIGAGTYVVKVTDANNCAIKTETYIINKPSPLKVDLISQTAKLCFGSAEGSIVIEANGGTPNQLSSGIFDYNYVWTGPNGFVSTSQNLNNLKAGTYNLIVTDNSGCTDDLSVTILETNELIIKATTTPITCSGLNNASINVTISGGEPSYQIAWSNMATGLVQNNLAAGDYTIKVTDAFGCEKELTINIPDVPVLNLNPVVKNVTCNAANDGSIALNLTGNTSNLKLVWSDGITAGTTRNNLAPGQYILTLNSGSPCEITRTFTITEPYELLINAGFSQPDACSTTDNGTIDLQVSGGTKPYNFSWTKNNIAFASTEDLSNLGAGIYNVSVTDANFCEVKFKTFVLTKPSQLKVNLINQTPKICFGSNDGSIVIGATGGTPIEITAGVFDYYYSWTGPNGFASSAQNLNYLYAGTYNLVVKDKSGCTQELTVIIPESDELIIKATTSPITCFGTNDGKIAVTVTGGIPNYQITWSNGATGLNLNDLTSGNYTITVKDALGCEKEMTINIAPVPALVLNPILKNATCFGVNDGSIDLNFANNSSAVSLLWSDGSTAGAIRNNLKPGIYKVTINSGSPCEIERTFEITAPLDLTINANISQPDACNPTDNGMIDLIVSGGTAPYAYQWSKNNITFASSEDLSNIGAGTYVVKVTDANNCAVKTATYTINKPSALAISLISQTSKLCFGSADGNIAIDVKGGTPILLSSGALDYNYTWTGPNGFKSNSKNLNQVIAGTYKLVVSDASGCSENMTVTILPSDEILITAKTTPITCAGLNNASIAVTISGGNPSYNVVWSNKGTSLTQNNLAPGNYTIFVTDAFGCEKQLTIKIENTPAINVNPIVKNVSCFGANDGSITLNFVGGNSGVKLNWNDGVTSGTTRNNLGPGTYTVNINNGSPCEIKRTFVILEPKDLEINATIVQPNNCNNSYSGAINLSVSGGNSPYSFEWSNGMTTRDLARLVAGNYMVTVTDANGCSKKVQYTLDNIDPIELIVETKTIVDCEKPTSQQDFEATVYGGKPPYTYTWSNGGSGKSNSSSMSTTKNGLITLLVKDANNCTANYSFNVKLPEVSKPDFENNSIGYTSYGMFSINDPIQFTNTTTGDYVSMLWDFGDGTFSTESNPVHTYTMPKHYVITQKVTYPYGCEYLNQVTLAVEKGYLLVVPNAFTPNNDRVNDTYRPVTKALTDVQMDVYDTWGSLIYSEKGDSLVGWDGSIKGKFGENGNFFCQVSGKTFYGELITASTTFVLIK